MARVRTLAEMIGQVRSLTDQERSEFVTDAEITLWLNQGLASVWQALVEANPDWYVRTVQLATTAGTLEYTLDSFTSNFGIIRGVDLVNGDRRRSLRSFNFQERSYYRGLDGQGLPKYRVMRNGSDGLSAALVFDRDPGDNTFDVHYLPVLIDLVSAADEFDGVAGYEDWAVHWACACVRGKAEEPELMRLHLSAIDDIKRRIAFLGRHRHMDGAPRIARTRRRARPNNWEFWD